MDQTYVILMNRETGEMSPFTKDQLPILTQKGDYVAVTMQEFDSFDQAAAAIDSGVYSGREIPEGPKEDTVAPVVEVKRDLEASKSVPNVAPRSDPRGQAGLNLNEERYGQRRDEDRARMDALANKAFDPRVYDSTYPSSGVDAVQELTPGGSGRNMPGFTPTDVGGPVGTSPTDWGLFEQDLMAGQVDPRRAVSEQLARQGLPTHANRGFLEDVYSNYGALRQMQNPGLTPEPVDLFNEQSQFSQDLFGMDGNSMSRVNTEQLWDNQFSDDYNTALGGQYSAASANGGNVGEQHQYEFNDINTNIAALAPFIGDQNAGYLMTLTQQAYDEYLNSPMRNQMTFATFLRDVKNAGEWY